MYRLWTSYKLISICYNKDDLMDFFLFHSKYFITVQNCQVTSSSNWRCYLSLSYLLPFCHSSRCIIVPSWWRWSRPNKSMYGIVLYFSRYFNGRWCGSRPLILCQNNIDFEDNPTSVTSSTMLVVFSSFTTTTSFTPASFSCTSKFYITFFVFCFCSFCILHLRVCVDCENGVRS